MENLILSAIVMACVTAVAIVFIVCFFKHLDSTGFTFKNKVVKDIQNLLEFETKANNTFRAIDKDMMAKKERTARDIGRAHNGHNVSVYLCDACG